MYAEMSLAVATDKNKAALQKTLPSVWIDWKKKRKRSES